MEDLAEMKESEWMNEQQDNEIKNAIDTWALCYFYDKNGGKKLLSLF